MAEEGTDSAGTPAAAQGGDAEALRVALVDDNPDDRALAARALRAALEDVEVVPVVDLESFTSVLESGAYDVLVTDYLLGWANGMEVLEEAKRRWPGKPVVMYTASGNEEVAAAAMKAGLDDYVLKHPTRGSQLANAVRGAMEHARLRGSEARLRRLVEEHAQLLGALARMSAESGAVALVADVCSALVELPPVDAAVVYQFAQPDAAVPLASAGTIGDQTRALRPTRERSRALFDRAALGPWVEDRVEGFGGAEPSAHGLGTIAFIPLGWHERQIGLLAVGSARAGNGEEIVARLPMLVDFAGAVSGVVGEALASGAEAAALHAVVAGVIERRAFRPVFQPVVDMASREVVGFEALTRFVDGADPARRFSEARLGGLEPELERACLEAAVERAAGLPRDAWLSINLSAETLTGPSPPIASLSHLARTCIVELTEHAPIADYRVVRRLFALLPDSIRLCIDDAGAGFASMRHIVELRPSFVKIDRSFVEAIDGDPARQALVAGMVHFTGLIDVDLIAEGVETELEADALRGLGVPLAQGYLFGRPAAVDDLDLGSRPRASGAGMR